MRIALPVGRRLRLNEGVMVFRITLIHQCDVLIKGLIEWKKRDFLEKGGIKEEMYQARKNWQKKNNAYGKIPYEGHGYNSGYNGQDVNRETKPIQPIRPTDPKE